jgi:hypothetical protein
MIVGILGKKRSGKDTTGDYLVNNKGFVKYSFANPIKRGAMELFGFTEDQVFGDAKDEIDPTWGITPRLVLQIMGTEVFQYDMPKYIPELQAFGRAFWVKRFEQWYEKNSDLNVVICDVRFQHEVDSILKMGGAIWSIQRPNLTTGDEHASEKEMDVIVGITSQIINDGTLNDLYHNIETTLNDLRKSVS